ncbi:GNAT family N-acetyltransferase [Nocardia sp. XZ_19_385]|uniref:GNAT family N-acetyltransferase n=1 Tax=Nocardia sp. XZ_19_385 TaxID=2769488 RepID=UPI00188DFA17|nr:GNAT family N-acetyltransferase [Nocardia sp. XZ_19_385]
MNRWQIRPLTAEHTRGLAECHIACWRAAYQGLVPEHVLAAFDVERLTQRWERDRIRNPGCLHVAVVDDTVIGFAVAAPNRGETAVAAIELNAIYVRSPWHGTGVADELLQAAVDPAASCSLWVFEENPRAQAFYRKHGFELDGARKVEEFSPAMQVRMVRPGR